MREDTAGFEGPRQVLYCLSIRFDMFQDIATDNDVVDTDRIEVEQVGLPHLKVVETQAGFDLLATRNGCCRVVTTTTCQRGNRRAQ